MTKKKKKQTSHQPSSQINTTQTFMEHLYELRTRLVYIAISVAVFGGIGYAIQEHLVDFLLAPAKNQQFIYTSPGGGINFLFQICTYFGVLLSIPVIIYQLLRYIEPVMNERIRKSIVKYCFFSGILAIIGLCFGYYIGLPAALNFLMHQFTNKQITALLTVDEYMSFVTVYLVGSALLFQIPLVLLFVNHIKPLGPRTMLKSERYVIVFAFIAAAIITPTPDIFNQMIIAGPIIAVYQLGFFLVWMHNRKANVFTVKDMREADLKAQQDRQAIRDKLAVRPLPTLQAPVTVAAVQATVKTPQPARPATLRMDVSPPRSASVQSRPTARRQYIDFAPAPRRGIAISDDASLAI